MKLPKTKIKSIFKKATTFLKEVLKEMKKINWLGPKETLKYTLIIIAVSVVIALFLGGIDFLFTQALEKFVL